MFVRSFSSARTRFLSWSSMVPIFFRIAFVSATVFSFPEYRWAYFIMRNPPVPPRHRRGRKTQGGIPIENHPCIRIDSCAGTRGNLPVGSRARAAHSCFLEPDLDPRHTGVRDATGRGDPRGGRYVQYDRGRIAGRRLRKRGGLPRGGAFFRRAAFRTSSGPPAGRLHPARRGGTPDPHLRGRRSPPFLRLCRPRPGSDLHLAGTFSFRSLSNNDPSVAFAAMRCR